jgi:hypothetical protein
MVAVDPRVDDRDLDASEPGRPLNPGVEAANGRDVPLPCCEERIARYERNASARRQALHVRDAAQACDPAGVRASSATAN